MRLKQVNVDKELKKVQGQGIYNKRVRILLVIGVVCLVVVIGSSFAAFSSDRILSAFTSSVSKKVKVTLSVENGSISGSNIKEGTYNENITYQVTPNSGYTYESSTCPNSSYNKETNTLTIKTTSNVSCNIKFKKLPNFSDIILANNTLQTSELDFMVAVPSSLTDTAGSGLYKTEDDDGESYYFRGAIENNYVSFANMIWRIVRINGDGTIRLIKEERVGQSTFNTYSNYDRKYIGYTYDNNKTCTIDILCGSDTGNSSTIKTYLENWYDTNLTNFDNKIAISNYCNDTKTYMTSGDNIGYGGWYRSESGETTLKCPNTDQTYGGLYKLKIGLLSWDETVFAGNSNYGAIQTNNYLYNATKGWTISPDYSTSSKAYVLNGGEVTANNEVYPVINLNANTNIVGGDGSKTNPYVVE